MFFIVPFNVASLGGSLKSPLRAGRKEREAKQFEQSRAQSNAKQRKATQSNTKQSNPKAKQQNQHTCKRKAQTHSNTVASSKFKQAKPRHIAKRERIVRRTETLADVCSKCNLDPTASNDKMPKLVTGRFPLGRNAEQRKAKQRQIKTTKNTNTKGKRKHTTTQYREASFKRAKQSNDIAKRETSFAGRKHCRGQMSAASTTSTPRSLPRTTRSRSWWPAGSSNRKSWARARQPKPRQRGCPQVHTSAMS